MSFCLSLHPSTSSTARFSAIFSKGFTEKKGGYATYKIAEAEKALLDWIYFHLKDGLPVEFDEIQFDRLSRSKLVAYAKKFPNTVIQSLFFPMLKGQIANLQP